MRMIITNDGEYKYYIIIPNYYYFSLYLSSKSLLFLLDSIFIYTYVTN